MKTPQMVSKVPSTNPFVAKKKINK
jgi:hypothetical protein